MVWNLRESASETILISHLLFTQKQLSKEQKKEKKLFEVVSAIIGIYESSRAVDLDVDSLFNRDFVLSHIYIGLQKDSTEDIIKRNSGLDGIESYLYIEEKNLKKKVFL